MALSAALACVCVILGAAPVGASWQPRMVPVGDRVGYAFFEYRGICHSGPPAFPDVDRAARRAFCHPTAPRPTAQAREAARMGWCFRWARGGGTHRRISATCARDLDNWRLVVRRAGGGPFGRPRV